MKIGRVEKKAYKLDFETGSGSLCIPVLGDLFPNLWGQKMNLVDKWILVVENTEYCVGKEVYDMITEGDPVEICDNNGTPGIKCCRVN
ncbi:MAG: hypothetical protein LBV43_11770 [Prevotella sp.]|jgi:hypothetical protein|nr:hypothetical protein [Prevotella sp.]